MTVSASVNPGCNKTYSIPQNCDTGRRFRIFFMKKLANKSKADSVPFA